MSSRRLSGEGSIRQRPDGRWEIRLRVGSHRYSRYAADKAGALAVLQELRGQHAAGMLTPATSLTLGAYLAEWLTAHAPALRPSTVESYRQLCGHAGPLKEVRLTRLEPRHIAALYGQKQQGLSAGRVLKLHRMLHKALGDAVRWGILPRNPAAGVDPPRPNSKQPQLWTLAQIRVFLAACEQEDRSDARLLAFLLLSGLRLGEALALTWADLDIEAGTIQVQRSLTHVEGKPIEGPPKTGTGVRTLMLPPEALAVLRWQHTRQVERRLAAGLTWQGGERVWTTSEGTAYQRQNVRRSLRALCNRAGLPCIRVHDLRHLNATLMVTGGVDPKTAQRRLGHATLQMTLQVYARSLSEADVQAASALSRLVCG